MQAFFPGFPLLSRAVSDALTLGASTEVSLVVAMWLVGGLACLGATVVLYRMADELAGERVATLTAILFVAGPYSIFLFANYSESLFLLFAVGAWYCGVRGLLAIGRDARRGSDIHQDQRGVPGGCAAGDVCDPPEPGRTAADDARAVLAARRLRGVRGRIFPVSADGNG